MRQFRDLAEFIQSTGEVVENDRTGTGTISAFGHCMRFDLSKGFPLLGLKRTYWKGVVHELAMFLKGSSDVRELQENQVHIWDEWELDGSIGPMYGTMWRKWPVGIESIDQLRCIVDQISKTPYSRRLLVSAWNPAYLPDETKGPRENVSDGLQALAPCHVLFQFKVHPSGKLDLLFFMRSSDYFLGLPFNVASYALLQHLVANECGLEVGQLVVMLGDTHIYANHLSKVREMLDRPDLPLPHLTLPKDLTIDNFDSVRAIESLSGYESHSTIKADVAV